MRVCAQFWHLSISLTALPHVSQLGAELSAAWAWQASRVDPGWQLSPAVGRGGNRKGRSEKTRGLRSGQSNRESKSRERAKQKKGFLHCFPSAGRRSAVSRRAGLHRTSRCLGKTKASPQMSPFLLPPALCAERDAVQHRVPLGSAGVSCPGCAPSPLLVRPQPPRRVRKRARRCAGAAQQQLERRCHPHCCGHRSQTGPRTGC